MSPAEWPTKLPIPLQAVAYVSANWYGTILGTSYVTYGIALLARDLNEPHHKPHLL